LIEKRFDQFEKIAGSLQVNVEQVEDKLAGVLEREKELEKENAQLQKNSAMAKYNQAKANAQLVNGSSILTLHIGAGDSTTTA
jgi:alanyl-tRNA synthetase